MGEQKTELSPQTPAGPRFSIEQIELLKRTIAKGCTTDELKLFLYQCERTGLDPFIRQIYIVKRRSRQPDGSWTEVAQTQTAIDGFRVIAERTGEYDGQEAALWCDEDGHWVDVWLKSTPPLAAKVSVYRKGRSKAAVGIAKWSEYVQTRQDGSPMGMWGKMQANQLAKCAEALAFRKAFPQDLSGLYTDDELKQADVNEAGESTVIDVVRSPLDDLGDDVRATIASAFAYCQLGPGQQAALVNEYLFGKSGADLVAAAHTLLRRCRHDYKTKGFGALPPALAPPQADSGSSPPLVTGAPMAASHSLHDVF